VRLRRNSLVIASMVATARAISPRTWAVRTGVPSGRSEVSAARVAGTALRSPVCGGVPGAGLGAAEGVISGNSPAALPPATAVWVPPRLVIDPGGIGAAEGVISGNSPAALPAAMTVVRVRFSVGRVPTGSVEPRPMAAGGGVDEARADGLAEAECVVLGVGLGFDVGVGLGFDVGLGFGDGDGERVALAVGVGLGVGDGDAERDTLGVGVGVAVGDADCVALGVGVGVGEAELVALGVGVGVEGEGEGDADVVEGDGEADFDGDGEADADGFGELEGLGLALGDVAARAAGLATFASAVPCMLTDSPEIRKPPVTRPTTTARMRARYIYIAYLRWLPRWWCDGSRSRIGSVLAAARRAARPPATISAGQNGQRS
jgi:hypothetical protein